MCYLLDLLVQVNIRRPGCHCCRLTIQCCIYKQAKHSSPKHLQVSCRYLYPMSDAINSIQAGYVGEDVESVIERLLQVLCP